MENVKPTDLMFEVCFWHADPVAGSHKENNPCFADAKKGTRRQEAAFKEWCPQNQCGPEATHVDYASKQVKDEEGTPCS